MKSSTATASDLRPRLGFLGFVVGKVLSSFPGMGLELELEALELESGLGWGSEVLEMACRIGCL